jgi:hypothetical protein
MLDPVDQVQKDAPREFPQGRFDFFPAQLSARNLEHRPQITESVFALASVDTLMVWHVALP